ncbi:hypothetical protein GGR95_002317 [Sulfitobacter undariae]|uniref:YhdP central domain-containing protein n=1 Tax=Sulfitobacter undariae TaxID=1563671 RepID=A0A7W6H2D1_9RHOB|nr:hypothetical protein [Sulfitobacter undariae]
MSDPYLMADPAPTAPPPVRPSRRKRGLLMLLIGLFNAIWSLVVLAVVIAVGAVYFFYDRPVVVPAWIEARIEQRLEEEFPFVTISFGELRFLMEEGWRPRIRLSDVSVETPEGAELIRFSEARVRFSMPALRTGKLQPAEVALRGVFMTIVRAPDGTLALQTALSGTRSAGTTRQSRSLGSVVEQIDAVLQQPGLAALDNAEMRGLTLQYIDQRAEKAFTLDGGRLIAVRKEGALVVNVDLALLGEGPGVTTLAANYSSVIGVPEAQFGVQLSEASAGDLATQSPAFAWMGALRAPISGALRSGVRRDGTLAPLSATFHIGAGVLQPNEGTKPIPFDSARSYFSYDSALGLVEFDDISVDSKWGSASGEGTASMTGLTEGTLEALVGQFRLTDIHANPLGLYPEPIELDRAEVDFRLQTAPFNLNVGRFDIFDQGQTRHAFGTLSAEPDGWKVALDARTQSVDPKRVLELWPSNVGQKTRQWLEENVYAAKIRDADFALRISPQQKPRIFLGMDFAEGNARFLPTLPPISQASGQVSLDGTRLVVSLDEGVVEAGMGGAVQVERSAFIIPDVTVKGGAPAVVRLNLRSSATAALWSLDQPPMSVMSRAGLPVDLGEGEVDASGTISFPLMRGGGADAVKFDVTGNVSNLTSRKLIKSRTLKSQRMAVTASDTGVEIAGRGTLDGVAFDGRWQQPLGNGSSKSTLRGTAQITPKALAAFNVGLPDGMVTGSTRASIGIDFAKGQSPRMSIRSDLRGAALVIPQLGWRKDKNTRGALDMNIRLGAKPAVTAMSLTGAGLSAKGSITLANSGGLDVLELDSLRVGDWLNVRAALVGQGGNRAPQVVVRGGQLDLRGAQFGGSGGSGGAGAPSAPAAPMQVRLDRLQITEDIWLQGLAGTFKTAGGIDGPFEARVNGKTGVSGRVLPKNGRTAVQMTSADAGGVLRSAGLLKQAVGGALELALTPVGNGSAYDGRAKITGVSIKDAPAMAALVNSLSVVGLVNEMNGDGIYFDEVEAEFRMTPGRFTLSRASAVGASLGLSADGVFATDTGQIAIQGVVTPVYLLNGIGSVLTRKGEGLLGFNYTLGGNTKAPKVSINPLSVLAPGGLRNVFRAPQTQVPTVEGETPPEPVETPKRPVVHEYEGR